MPTYVYKFIDSGETIEVQQAFSDPTLTEYTHPETGRAMPVKKVFQPVGVTFKGDGFYKTDSRASKGGGSSGSTDASATSAASSSDSTASSSSSSTDTGSTPKSTTSETSTTSSPPSSADS